MIKKDVDLLFDREVLSKIPRNCMVGATVTVTKSLIDSAGEVKADAQAKIEIASHIATEITDRLMVKKEKKGFTTQATRYEAQLVVFTLQEWQELSQGLRKFVEAVTKEA